MTASAFTRARMWRILICRRTWMAIQSRNWNFCTYEDRFLSHKDSGNKIRNPGINFPQVAGLPSFWSIELLVSEGFTLTFNWCSAQRSDFLNCPDIVLTFPMSNSYQGPAAHLRSFVPSASRIVPGGILSGQKTEMRDFTYNEELGQWAVDLSWPCSKSRFALHLLRCQGGHWTP